MTKPAATSPLKPALGKDAGLRQNLATTLRESNRSPKRSFSLILYLRARARHHHLLFLSKKRSILKRASAHMRQTRRMWNIAASFTHARSCARRRLRCEVQMSECQLRPGDPEFQFRATYLVSLSPFAARSPSDCRHLPLE